MSTPFCLPCVVVEFTAHPYLPFYFGDFFKTKLPSNIKVFNNKPDRLPTDLLILYITLDITMWCIPFCFLHTLRNIKEQSFKGQT